MARLLEYYRDEVIPALVREFDYRSVMEVPRLHKITINVGIGEAIQNARALDAVVSDLRLITGQQPVIRRAKRSVAAFKLRTGMPVGVSVTLRGQRMYEFLDRLVNITLPRIRDFRGISGKSFDGRGNYSLGLREQLVFPEINYDEVDKIRGLEISITTTARTDEEGKALLTKMGMPFRD
jgi:large subunit ribosomal protein L5